MNTKQFYILWWAFVATIAISIFATSYLYNQKLDEQIWKKQLVEVEKSIAILNVNMNEEVADLNQLQEQVNSKKQIIATMSGELSLQQKKQKDIKTAIYYLNKSLWIEQK